MAMLVLNDVFEQVWGKIIRNYPKPQTEFWAEAITSIRQNRPGYIFLGEVYWSLEKELHQLGFDFTYDKNLYDRLLYGKTPEILQQLMTNGLYQPRMARFIENHDEPRAAVSFGKEKSWAAATVIMTLPGLRLIHDGQKDGKTLKIPVQLSREPDEPVDTEVKSFYELLLEAVNHPVFHDGEWHIIEAKSPSGKPHQQVLAWYWQLEQDFKLVLINYAAKETQAMVQLPALWREIPNTFIDILTGHPPEFTITESGMQFSFKPYQSYILST
jgi:hypothetical protein